MWTLPGFSELSVQVFGDLLVLKVIILCPVDSKMLIIDDQFQDGPEALGCVEISNSIPVLPAIDCEQLQGILWGQWLPQLLLTQLIPVLDQKEENPQPGCTVPQGVLRAVCEADEEPSSVWCTHG